MGRARLLIAAFLVLSLSAAAHAAQRHRFNLPAGRLEDSAIIIGQQAGINIGIRDSKLSGRRVGAVRGVYSVKDALRRLLEGTGARAVPLDSNTWLIVRSPARPRPRARQVTPVKAHPGPARRLAPADEEIAEIIVTGSKRRLSLADYPGSAIIVDGSDRVFEGLRGTDALVERIPSVTTTHLGPGRNKLFLRGIADSSFNGPTQAIVGQYFGETRLNYNAPDPDLRLHDLHKVEILPGPQGTLYGAGSLGGIIRIVPNPPELERAEATLATGASATQHGEPGADGAAMLNLPLVEDRLGLRLVGYAETEGGYIDDAHRGLKDVNRTRIIGGRFGLRARSGNGWTIDVGVVGQRIDGDDAQFADRDGPPLVRHSQVQQDFRNSYLLADIVTSKSWDDLRLVTTTGLVRQTLRERYDSARRAESPTVFEQQNNITMFSAETRLSRDKRRGFGWVIGASFIRNRSEQERSLGDPEAPSPITGVRNSAVEVTLYGEGTVLLSKALSLTAGARLSHSKLSGAPLDLPLKFVPFLGGVRADRAETSFLPSFGFTAQASPALALYMRYQQGFRPGGLAVKGDFVQRYQNDRVASIEGGLRYVGPGGLGAAASIAYTAWRDIQADTIDFSGLPSTENIGDGRIWTLDLGFGWKPIPGLKAELGAVLNESKVTNPAPSVIISAAGPLPNVARLNARFGTEYRLGLTDELGLRLAASARYVGKSRLGIGPILGEEHGDWLDSRLAVHFEHGHQSFSLIASNLLNQKGNRFAFGSPFTLVERPQVTPLRPRTVRLGWEMRF